jgi:hypothetical protein
MYTCYAAVAGLTWSGADILSCLLQAGDKRVHFAQHIRFVRDKNVMTGIGQPNDMGGRHPIFKSVCLCRGVSQITCL